MLSWSRAPRRPAAAGLWVHLDGLVQWCCYYLLPGCFEFVLALPLLQYSVRKSWSCGSVVVWVVSITDLLAGDGLATSILKVPKGCACVACRQLGLGSASVQTMCTSFVEFVAQREALVWLARRHPGFAICVQIVQRKLFAILGVAQLSKVVAT